MPKISIGHVPRRHDVEIQRNSQKSMHVKISPSQRSHSLTLKTQVSPLRERILTRKREESHPHQREKCLHKWKNLTLIKRETSGAHPDFSREQRAQERNLTLSKREKAMKTSG